MLTFENRGLTTGLLLVSLAGGCAQLPDSQLETISLEEHAAETLKLKGRISELEDELAESRQANLELQQANAELRERIEMLKVLDHAVEEKRKSYNSK